MISRRRLALQLTPLLDLMLIVMFSQYLENRNRSVVAEEELQAEREQLMRQRAELEQEFQQQQGRLQEAWESRVRSLSSQHTAVAELLSTTLNLPEQAIREVTALRAAGRTDDAARLQAATDRLQTQMPLKGAELFRFLLQVDEMQKHVSLWEVHVEENGKAQIRDGQRSATIDYGTEEEFATRLFEAGKTFGDPRNLVLVLLTWGDAQLGARQKATRGIPRLLELLRRDSAGIRWYDFSVIGYRPEGPIFDAAR
jgi:hypothetical protein